jgi:tetratricopeptide (TPR) repeat protein
MKSIKELYEIGNKLLNEGDYDLAFESFDEILAEQPESIEASIGAATALNGLEEYSDSLEIIEKAIELEPENYQLWIVKGEAKAGLKEYESALNYYQKALELNPPTNIVSLIWKYKSISLYELERYQESIQAVNQALDLNLDSAKVGDAIYLKARCYASIKNDELALASLEKAFKSKPSLKIWIKQSSDWDSLYSEQKFQAILGTEVPQESIVQFFNEVRKNNTSHVFFHDFARNHEDVVTSLWGTQLNQLPKQVREAYNFYKTRVEGGDFGSVGVYKFSSTIVPIYVIFTSTDGDIGYLEIYTATGEEIGCGKYDADVINWSNQETTRTDLIY